MSSLTAMVSEIDGVGMGPWYGGIYWMRQSVSLCMIVRNEAPNLPRCLSSTRDVVSEMIIVDTGSKDDTVQIARSFGATVVHEPWRDDFAAARNRGLDLATGEWVLLLDADEQLAEPGKQHIPGMLAIPEVEGWLAPMINLLGDDRAGNEEISLNLKLIRNRRPYRFEGAVHEQILPSILAAKPDAKIVLSPMRIIHYGYRDDERIRQDKHGRNMRILSRMLEQTPDDPYVHYNLGLEYTGEKKYERALVHFTTSLKGTAANIFYRPKLIKCIAIALGNLGQWKEALHYSDLGVSDYPGFTDLHYMKGLIHQRMNRHAEAIACFDRCLGLGPAQSPPYLGVDRAAGGAKAHYSLGQSYRALGETSAAIAAYVRAAQAARGWAAPLERVLEMTNTPIPAHVAEKET